VTSKLQPTIYLQWVKFVTNDKKKISDFRQRPIPRVHEEHILINTWVMKRQFLWVQVTVKVTRAYNPGHNMRLNPAYQFNAHCTSIGENCMLLFVLLLSDEASWCIHMIHMHSFEAQYSSKVNNVALWLIMSLWLNDAVFTRYYTHHLHISDYLWPIH